MSISIPPENVRNPSFLAFSGSTEMEVFWASYVRYIYVLCPAGNGCNIGLKLIQVDL